MKKTRLNSIDYCFCIVCFFGSIVLSFLNIILATAINFNLINTAYTSSSLWIMFFSPTFEGRWMSYWFSGWSHIFDVERPLNKIIRSVCLQNLYAADGRQRRIFQSCFGYHNISLKQNKKAFLPYLRALINSACSRCKKMENQLDVLQIFD